MLTAVWSPRVFIDKDASAGTSSFTAFPVLCLNSVIKSTTETMIWEVTAEVLIMLQQHKLVTTVGCYSS